MIKRNHLMFFTIVLMTFMLSCNSNSEYDSDGAKQPQKLILKVAHNGKEIHPYNAGFLKFKEVMEKETDGLVEVQIFSNSQLGSEEEASQMVEMGLISASVVGSGVLANVVPEVDIFNLPFIFRDLDHFYRVMDGSVGKRVAKAIEEELDCLVLGYWFSGIRNVWSSKRPILSPEDLADQKIRVMASPILVKTFNSLGAQATPMSFGQLYSALQMKVVDGAETDHIDLLQERFYEVTKYVSYTNHTFLAAPIIFSKKQFAKLSPELQKMVVKAGIEATKAERDNMETVTAEALTELKKLGLEFFEVDKALFKSKVVNVYKDYADKVGGIEFIKEIEKL